MSMVPTCSPLDSVTVPNARFQRDNQQLNVMVKGDSQIDNTLVMCSATLRERALGRSEGFVNMQVENGGILIKNNISLLSVHLDQLTVNYNSRISLSSGTEIKQADANAKLTLAGPWQGTGSGGAQRLCAVHRRPGQHHCQAGLCRPGEGGSGI